MSSASAYRQYKLIEHLFTQDVSVLDYGCGPGGFLQRIGGHIREGIGIDLDRSLIEAAARRNRFPHIQYLHADAKAGLPFDADRFNVIVAFGVLEHVGPERPFIQEFHRLLRADGSLVIDVPSKGPFRALDIGNLKYNFPKLHKWFYYYVARRPKYYDQNFGPQAAMVGQFSRDATEHRHYSAADLAAVAGPFFEMERFGHYGLFFELIQFLEAITCEPFSGKVPRFFSWLIHQDCRLLSPIGRANIVGVFRKQPGLLTSARV